MWRERQEQSLWLSPVSSCNLTTAISATEGKRKPLCTHTSFFLLTRFSCTTSSLALSRGWLTSFLTDLPEPVSDKLPLSILLSHPLLPLPSCHLSATFFAAPSVLNGFVCFSSNQVLPEKQVHNLSESKIKSKVMIKENTSFWLLLVQSSHLASISNSLPEDCFICWICTSSFFAGYAFHSSSQFFPRCLSREVFHAKWQTATFVWGSGSCSERTSLEAAGWEEKCRKSFEIERHLFESLPSNSKCLQWWGGK